VSLWLMPYHHKDTKAQRGDPFFRALTSTGHKKTIGFE
jgi:hypothetical protein